ncbi:MAG: PocR ligand-binding domain-containing protein [Victivallales bacterium]
MGKEKDLNQMPNGNASMAEDNTLQYDVSQAENPNLVDGKYSIKDLVDIEKFRPILEKFSKATGFTTGFLSYPALEILIATGWRDICTKFHRACPASACHCKASNVQLIGNLTKSREMNIQACDNGMYDGATPIIIRDKLIAYLATGQALFAPPDEERFKKQAAMYGYDEKSYLEALRKVPVVSEEQFRKTMDFLSEIAVILAENGLRNLEDKDRAEEIAAEKEQLAVTLASIADGVIVTDMSGNVTLLNKVAEKLTGWPHSEAFGKSIEEVFQIVKAESCEACESTVRMVLKNIQTAYLPANNLLKARYGGGRILSGSAAPILDRHGDIRGVVLVFRDITERKSMEEKIRQAEKMEAVGQLAGGIAHDFNNQLMGIMGYAEILYNRLDDVNLRNDAENIMRASKRASDLTSNLLAFSRKGKYLSVPVNVHKIIEEVVSILEHSIDRRIEVKRVFKASPATINGDPTQFQNALLNLSLNARDALPNGGEIVFTTENVKMEDVFSREDWGKAVKGRYLKICVIDDGIGMSDDMKKHIFEPFFTTKEPGKGTGMGLASVYGMVKNHNGAINVSSVYGEGTIFSLYFPLLEDSIETDNIKSELVSVRKEAKILLADDEELVRSLVSNMLRSLGHKVVACKDGAEALELYRNSWRDFDLVILDMMMPRINGRDAFIKMHSINRDIKALLISGFSIDGEAQSLLDAGMKGFIQKPFNFSEFTKAVEKVLNDDGMKGEGKF